MAEDPIIKAKIRDLTRRTMRIINTSSLTSDELRHAAYNFQTMILTALEKNDFKRAVKLLEHLKELLPKSQTPEPNKMMQKTHGTLPKGFSDESVKPEWHVIPGEKLTEKKPEIQPRKKKKGIKVKHLIQIVALSVIPIILALSSGGSTVDSGIGTPDTQTNVHTTSDGDKYVLEDNPTPIFDNPRHPTESEMSAQCQKAYHLGPNQWYKDHCM